MVSGGDGQHPHEPHLVGVQSLRGRCGEELLVVRDERLRDGGSVGELIGARQGAPSEGLLHETAEAPGVDGPHRTAR